MTHRVQIRGQQLAEGLSECSATRHQAAAKHRKSECRTGYETEAEDDIPLQEFSPVSDRQRFELFPLLLITFHGFGSGTHDGSRKVGG